MSSAEADIEDIVRHYLDGLYRCDTGFLARVFHPQALYATAAGDVPVIMDMPSYLPVVARRDPPARSGDERRERIVSIDVVGPSTAFVKLECRFFQKDYVDFLTLIRVDGRWQIIAKVFHFTPVRE